MIFPWAQLTQSTPVEPAVDQLPLDSPALVQPAPSQPALDQPALDELSVAQAQNQFRAKRNTSKLMVVIVSALVLLTACSSETTELIMSQPGEPVNGAGQVSASPDSEGNSSEGAAPSEFKPADGGSEGSDDSSIGNPPTKMSTDPNQVYEAGTCYRSSDESSEPALASCDSEHDIAIYKVDELPGEDDAPFKGFEEARALCDPAFKSIAGIGIGLATILERTVLRPSEETWAQGDRTVTCLVQYPEIVDKPLSEIDPVRGFGLVSPYGMEVGDCFADFEDGASNFKLVPCDESHDVEVFVAEALLDGPFPGDSEAQAMATELCFGQRFEDFVGNPNKDSDLLALRSIPTEASWKQGDRKINCLLSSNEARTGSLKDSGL